MEMKSKYYLLLLIIAMLFCCKKNTHESNTISYNIFYDSIPKKNNRVKTLKLKAAIQKKMNGSQSYGVTTDYIDTLNTAPLSEVDEIAYILNEQLEDLPQELDSTLKTKGVLSRIKQMETFSRAINFEISKQNRDTTKINTAIIKVIESFNNLIIQLNETNARLPEDFKKQLEEAAEIKKDTIEGVPLF